MVDISAALAYCNRLSTYFISEKVLEFDQYWELNLCSRLELNTSSTLIQTIQCLTSSSVIPHLASFTDFHVCDSMEELERFTFAKKQYCRVTKPTTLALDLYPCAPCKNKQLPKGPKSAPETVGSKYHIPVALV